MSVKAKRPIAVREDSVIKFGCPSCNYRSGYNIFLDGRTTIRVCGDCGTSYAVLAPGTARSSICFEGDRPKLKRHPRRGIPAHGRSDKRPEGGGEFFASRGIGLDTTPGCFVCGGSEGLRSNIAAFVECKRAGERVVAMFSQGARLDCRDLEPDYVQVKVGACPAHLANLEQLNQFVQGGIITHAHISEAMRA